MTQRALLRGLLVFLVATSAAAQQRPIFDPDDFVDPRQRDGTVFISRIVVGGAWNFIDDYRPVGQDVGFLHLTNSLYTRGSQFDFKHSEVVGEDAPPIVSCGCQEPIYFPTPPTRDSTPAAPAPGRKETVQVAFYAGLRAKLRYRLSMSWQPIDTDIRSFSGEVVERRSGRETSVGLDADTHFRIGGRDLWGSVLYARTVRKGTVDDRTQHELAYTSRLPGKSIGPVLFRGTLTIGGISGRGAGGLNLVNPAIEAFWHDHRTRANVHLVWSGLTSSSGAEGWETNHQIAFFVDRALFVKLWR